MSLTREELDAFDPHPSQSGGQLRYSCPFAECEVKPRDREHQSLVLEPTTGAWYCHRCENKGRLPEFDSTSRTTRYAIRDESGEVQAVHIRHEKPEGKTFTWELPDGTTGLRGRKVPTLPLYGSECLAGLPDGAEVWVCEGEKAADSLRARGLTAIGTVTGARTTPGDEALRPLIRLTPILWPDNDAAGYRHMRDIAERLHALGSTNVRRFIPEGDWAKGADAADFDGLPNSSDATPVPVGPAKLNGDSWPNSDAVAQLEHSTLASVQVVRLADVQAESVEWVAYPYIPRAKFTILEGDPGVGKSWMTLSLAKAVTLGAKEAFPGLALENPEPVLLASAEDGLADTIRPRLDALGADVRLVHALDGVLTFDAEGLGRLEAVIAQVRPALVAIDPLVAYLGADRDLHRSNEMRAVTSVLAAIANRQGCAIIGIRHLAKGQSSRAAYRGIGSIDLTAAARSVLLVGRDPETGECGMAHTKSNLGPAGPTQGFTLDGECGFRWTGESSLTPARLLAAEPTEESRGATAEAVEWLREMLAPGPMLSQDLKRRAVESGIADRTLKRAANKLGVQYGYDGVPPRTTWYLPPEAAA